MWNLKFVSFAFEVIKFSILIKICIYFASLNSLMYILKLSYNKKKCNLSMLRFQSKATAINKIASTSFHYNIYINSSENYFPIVWLQVIQEISRRISFPIYFLTENLLQTFKHSKISFPLFVSYASKAKTFVVASYKIMFYIYNEYST